MPLDFRRRGNFEKSLYSLEQIKTSCLDRISLADYIQFRACGNIGIVFTFNDGG